MNANRIIAKEIAGYGYAPVGKKQQRRARYLRRAWERRDERARYELRRLMASFAVLWVLAAGAMFAFHELTGA